MTRRVAISASLAGVAALLVAAGPVAAQTGARGAPQCPFATPQPSRPDEKAPRKGIRTFDKVEPQRALSPYEPVPPGLRGAIRRVELPKGSPKLVALTLDLCEQSGEIAGYDGVIFEYLRREKVKATLFTGGKWMRSHEPRTNELILDPLFEIGNHGWAHRNARLLAGPALAEEIGAPQRAYEAIRSSLVAQQCTAAGGGKAVPRRIGLYRFPFGACHKAALNAVNDAGLLAIQWDLSTGDPSPTQSARAIADAMVKRTRPGSIIIAHANGRGFNTGAALPLAIPKLRAMGFEFVTVSELLAAGRPEVVQSCYDSRPGDTDRYDNLFAIVPRAVSRDHSRDHPTPKDRP